MVVWQSCTQNYDGKTYTFLWIMRSLYGFQHNYVFYWEPGIREDPVCIRSTSLRDSESRNAISKIQSKLFNNQSLTSCFLSSLNVSVTAWPHVVYEIIYTHIWYTIYRLSIEYLSYTCYNSQKIPHFPVSLSLSLCIYTYTHATFSQFSMKIPQFHISL